MNIALALAIPFTIAAGAYYTLRRPTNRGPWGLEQSVLPYATRDENRVTIHNVRTFEYFSAESYRSHYKTTTYDLNAIESLDYIIDDFGEGYNAAHVFASFGFKDGNHIAFSVEARRRPWQEYSAFWGLFRRFTLMYVAAEETDILKLRSVYWKHDVRVYPIKATPEQLRALFESITTRINTLRKKPEFYNTLLNACGTNLLRHANEVSKKRVRLSLPVIAPGASDKALFDAGLIDTNLTFEQARKYFLVSERATQYKTDPAFSTKIRAHYDRNI